MEIKEQTFKDQKFIVSKGTVHPEYSFFTFEGEERDFRDKYWDIKSGDVVFDVGASYGTYTLSALSMGAKVFSFEPEPTVFCDLVRNVDLNNWSSQCMLFNSGLWSSKMSLDMKSYAPHWPEQTISCSYAMETLDNISSMSKLNKLDWMKIDVEGAEENVIRGGLQTISKFAPKLIIECHIFLDPKIIENIKSLLLMANDYEFEEVPRPPCTMLCATVRK